jgi:dipeptidyl aminopeptidase/acylaminoacyl peptidase
MDREDSVVRATIAFRCLAVLPCIWLLVWGHIVLAASPVTPRDCVLVKTITGIWLSNNGSLLAYVIKAPNIETNRNDFSLYIKSTDDDTESLGKLIASGTEISGIQWLDGDNRMAALLSTQDESKHIVIIDLRSGFEERLPGPGNVESFSVDGNGNTIAYVVPVLESREGRIGARPVEDIATGYRISYGEDVNTGTQTDRVYILRRDTSTGQWNGPIAIDIENPFTHLTSTSVMNAEFLSLSPDGKYLLLNCATEVVPEGWKSDPLIRQITVGYQILLQYDLQKGTTTLPLNTVYVTSVPFWSKNGKKFLVNAPAPIGSQWASEDIHNGRHSVADADLFEVDAISANVREVSQHVYARHQGPVQWAANGDVIVEARPRSFSHYQLLGDTWVEMGHSFLPVREQEYLSDLTSNGASVFGIRQSVRSSENLFRYNSESKRFTALSDINPQIATLGLAPVQSVSWSTPEGLNVFGLLFVPPNYLKGTRYPLVIQTKGDQGWFTCDAGFGHSPSFAAQPIANAGMMYLIRTSPENYSFQQDMDKRPKGYPGEIGEAVQQMEIWDSAVEMLDKRGLVDPHKVGIIGFSRTGWQVEFDLVHARTRYAAATAADNVQYNLSEYALLPWVTNDFDSMYGGPPYGKSFGNWLKYSVSFNIANIHTPLLLEVMGGGALETDELHVATPLAIRYEVTTGLGRLSRPFEMYYYPNEAHQPEHPKARLASIVRNVDWYRFWLQGYERPNPEDSDQYKRWEHLRDLHEADLANSKPIDPSTSK